LHQLNLKLTFKFLKDEYGRKAIHLAAQQNHSNVVRLLIKHQPALVSSANKEGHTCAHMAAMQGSVAVLQQLMKFDLSVVTSSRNRTSESTPLHMAAEGGHADVIKMLLDAGANPQDENKV
jgi:ankyrin repeat protein